ncbi:ATP-dependent DNA ligase LigD phosphoesterase module /ATP-dependent DNA ligase LigD polymerase module [Sphingobium sp. AP50]|uniref:DNA ligase D n=1 Tax=Sphingobium sp. AP50 TaxID=1884369 RepID=UPI0008B0CCB4|nr:DNA ligase D [Sphingobium sp. AP50]SEJ97758.1 ATP-dependent DNA ligase LigD phosphoesterase module /ATP-dependent DNA ligase LigD polymerase module [Sphingobium sp. AP50]
MGKAQIRTEDSLATYRAKRDFARTAEPTGATQHAAGNGFVVQKHAASRLHYDFRLELDGVLLSWAVTRGPSANPDDKRLAVRTEDHPLDYARFEGTIPKGEYGGGTVMLWDNGTWESIAGKDPRETLPEGHLHFILHGRRMQGEWILFRMKPRGKEKGENWILRKVNDAFAGGSDDLVGLHLTSIDTGRTMEEIAAGKPIARSKAKASPAAPASAGKFARTKKRSKAGDVLPSFRPVQLATLVDHVPPGDRWLHELKYDGYRMLIAIGGGEGRAYTRSGLDWSDRFAELIGDAAMLDAQSALIDGEAVVVLPDGRTSFHALQAALKGDPNTIDYFAFDLLELNGEDLTPRPLLERKELLAALIGQKQGHLRYSDHIIGRGEQLFENFCSAGLEGVISKRTDARYSGSRSGTWVKTKCIRRQEFVVVGWTPSDKQRGFRALLLGVNEKGVLRYAGKVGTGFSGEEIERLMALMAPLQQKTPTVEAPRAAVRGAHWIKPKLVAEVAFIEFTDEGVLRHSSYLGLREDKKPEAVVVETEVPVGELTAPAASATVKISNRERVIFPEGKHTKGQLADYYEAVAEIMLPWSGSRPISLVRCPQGRDKKCFFQKHDAGSFGDEVKHVAIREKDGHDEPYLFVDTPAGLLTCVQMGTIEFHGWGARIEDVEKADRLVFDLDPDEGLEFKDVVSAALHLQDVLGQMGLATFPMVTGGKGVHVIAPLTPTAEWPVVKDFAHRFAMALAQADPDRFTAALAKAKRTGRIFIDYLRNQRGATAVMPYSARSRPFAPIAVPLSWEELRDLDSPAHWHIGDAAEMVKRARSKALAQWGRADQILPDL